MGNDSINFFYQSLNFFFIHFRYHIIEQKLLNCNNLNLCIESLFFISNLIFTTIFISKISISIHMSDNLIKDVLLLN